jgi:hypothetical protein
MPRRVSPMSLALILLLLTGCPPPPPAPPPKLYLGPTLTMADLISQINARNQQIPTLFANFDHFKAWFVDPKTNQTHYVDGEGNLQYTSPNKIRLRASNDLYGNLFDMGSDGEKYWVSIQQGNEVWEGTYNTLMNVGPQDVPLQPDLVPEVLGVRPIDPDMNEQPVPVMRFDNESDAYIITWNLHLPDRWVAQKEVWYDRASLMPTLVKLYDSNGRALLVAKLSKPGPVKIDGIPQNQWPEIQTHYDLFFPPSGAKMAFDLADVSLSHNGHPNAANYRMPNWDANQVVHNLDEPNPN